MCINIGFFFFLVAQLWPWQSFLRKSFVWLSCHLGVSVVNQGLVACSVQRRPLSSSNSDLKPGWRQTGRKRGYLRLSFPASGPTPELLCLSLHPPVLVSALLASCFCQAFFAGTSLAGSRVHYVFNGLRFRMAFSLNIQSTPKVNKDTTQCWEFTLVTDRGQICPRGGIGKRSDTGPSIGLNALR